MGGVAMSGAIPDDDDFLLMVHQLRGSLDSAELLFVKFGTSLKRYVAIRTGIHGIHSGKSKDWAAQALAILEEIRQDFDRVKGDADSLLVTIEHQVSP
jgi:hypothetical protein